MAVIARQAAAEHDALQFVPLAEVLPDLVEALADPQAVARAMVQSIEHPVTGAIPQLGPVPKLSRTPAQIRSAPPLLGEQTASVLADLLGFDAEQIEQLRRVGAIGT